jgi:Cdc6-like AAA superfamily ATPase
MSVILLNSPISRRRAVEIAERNSELECPETPSKKPLVASSHDNRVTTGLIQSVLQDFLRHPIQKTLKFLPFTSKLFLAALLQQTRRVSGKTQVTFGDVLEETARICLSSVKFPAAKIVMKGVTVPRGLERAGVELEMCKVIMWEEKGGRRGGRVGLQISEDELAMAITHDDTWKKLMK